jgi:hypothetical protein
VCIMHMLLAAKALSRCPRTRPFSPWLWSRERDGDGGREPAAKFDKFAEDIKGFEKTIYRLVAWPPSF